MSEPRRSCQETPIDFRRDVVNGVPMTTTQETKPTFQTKKSSELRTGDVVRAHGMRCLLGEIRTYESRPYGPVFHGCADVLNYDEVVAEDPTLRGYIRIASEGHAGPTWCIQGNDNATWLVEVAPA